MSENLISAKNKSLANLVKNNTGRTRFKKGNVANPAGRPKGLAALIREKTKDGFELVEFQLAVLRCDVKKLGQEPTIHDRQKATEYLTERGFGKVVDRVELSGPMGGPVEISRLDVEQLKAVAMERGLMPWLKNSPIELEKTRGGGA